ncbi:hypothetical protein LPJ69_004962, partial [Coemansia sp. RSA 1752]
MFNNVVAACAQCSLTRCPLVSWLIDGFYRVGVCVSFVSMVVCVGVLCTAAVQIAARIGAKAGYPLADAWSMVLEVQKYLGVAHFDQRATPHVGSDSQHSRLSRRLVGTPDPQVLRPIIPGVTLPTGHLWHYLLALSICAIIHELGHAFAAARARVPLRNLGVFVMGIYPGAFVELCKTKLDQASVGSRLSIVCAGVWHNAVTVLLVFVLVRSGGLGAVFSHTGWTRVTNGVVISDVASNSPLHNRIPLLSTVYRIDDVICVLPSSPFASSRVVRIYYHLPNNQTEHMLLYAGSPTELWLDVQVSSLCPRYSYLPHTLPSWIETLMQYILSFSLAFCLLNALPAYYLDGDLAFKMLITAVEQRARVARATK